MGKLKMNFSFFVIKTLKKYKIYQVIYLKLKINERVIKVADYIITSNKTVREISKVFHVSKSTIHKDLHERLKKIDMDRFKKVDKILKYHISIRHINGGNATKRKYSTHNYK